MSRILVCGGRHYADREYLYAALDKLAIDHGRFTVVHGGAQGADTLAGDWAAYRKHPVDVFYADWNQHGHSAGPRRNTAMLASGVDLVVAVAGGKGTANMIRQATGKRVVVLDLRHLP